jgi:hypothetical protein
MASQSREKHCAHTINEVQLTNQIQTCSKPSDRTRVTSYPDAVSRRLDGDNVRREKALDFSGCKSRPGTGSLHPVAIKAAVEATKLLKPSIERVALS